MAEWIVYRGNDTGTTSHVAVDDLDGPHGNNGLYSGQCHSLFSRFGRLDWGRDGRPLDTLIARLVLAQGIASPPVVAFLEYRVVVALVEARFRAVVVVVVVQTRWAVLCSGDVFHCLYGHRHGRCSRFHFTRLVQSWDQAF